MSAKPVMLNITEIDFPRLYPSVSVVNIDKDYHDSIIELFDFEYTPTTDDLRSRSVQITNLIRKWCNKHRKYAVWDVILGHGCPQYFFVYMDSALRSAGFNPVYPYHNRFNNDVYFIGSM